MRLIGLLVAVAGCGGPPNVLILEGDSLTMSGVMGYADAVAMPADWEVMKHGTGAQTLATMVEQQAVNFPAEPGRPTAIVLWAGTNDIYFGATAAETFASARAFCESARAVGTRSS